MKKIASQWNNKLKIVGILVLAAPVVLAGAPGGRPPAVVAGMTVQASSSVERVVKQTGTVVALQGVSLASQVAGRVEKIFFHSGQKVKAGAPVLALDDKVVRAATAKDNATLVAAKQHYERIKALYQRHVVAAAQLESAAADWKAAKAALAGEQASLEHMNIRAPFSGRLGLREVSIGDYLQPGQRITQLESLTPIQVNFNVSDTLIRHLKTGMPVTIQTRAYPGDSFLGKISAIDAAIDTDTRTLTVQAILSNQKEKLLPGMFVEVTLSLKGKNKVIRIPQTAVVYDEAGPFVYVVDHEQKVKRKPVVLGMRAGNDVVIEKGLVNNDKIVVTGQNKIHNGAKVQLVPNTLE